MLILIIAGTFVLGSSGYILKYLVTRYPVEKFNPSLINTKLPLYTAFFGILASTQLRDFHEASLFLLAAIAQFMAFVFVSILRQKGSFFWHSVANFFSHGTWYMVMGILSASQTYWMLFILYLAGIVGGRIAGVNWANFVVAKYNLKSDATRDPNIAPGQRLNYLKREPTLWFLIFGLIAYIIYGSLSFDPDLNKYLRWLIGLSIAQYFISAISSRAAQRGHNWFIAIASLFAGSIFVIQTVILFSKNMPIELFIPYVFASTLGSATGAFVSMIIEYKKKIRPDEHIKKAGEQKQKALPIPEWKKRLPYAVILPLVIIWIFSTDIQIKILGLFGLTISELKFPISIVTTPMPRIFILLTATVIFFLDNALHTVTSRAGNRNHTGYHVSSLIPKGFIDFFRVSYLSMNTHIPDIIPISIMSACLGTLCGKDVSERIELWLQARMDIEPEKPKPKPATA